MTPTANKPRLQFAQFRCSRLEIGLRLTRNLRLRRSCPQTWVKLRKSKWSVCQCPRCRRLTVGKFAWLSAVAEMEAAIKRMTAEGYSDAVIAEHLTAAGDRSPRAAKVLESMVPVTRLRLGLLRWAHQSHPRRVDGFLTIPPLAKNLEVARWWISERIHNGTIKVRKASDFSPLLCSHRGLVDET